MQSFQPTTIGWKAALSKLVMSRYDQKVQEPLLTVGPQQESWLVVISTYHEIKTNHFE